MGRCKLPMQLIERSDCKKATYLKRSKGLVKKARELSTLCNVDLAVIMFTPEGDLTKFCNTSMEDVIARYAKIPQEERDKYHDEMLQHEVPSEHQDYTYVANYVDQRAEWQEVVDHYDNLEQPGSNDFILVLKACTSLGDLQMGTKVHVDIVEAGIVPDINLVNALIDMYAKFESVDMAQQDTLALDETSIDERNLDDTTLNLVLEGKIQKLEEDLDLSQRYSRILAGDELWGLELPDLEGLEAQLEASLRKVRVHKRDNKNPYDTPNYMDCTHAVLMQH